MSSRPTGALALVLHSHMPYVEGFGTWPFGEEWLWEAVACVYLPLLEVLDGAPVTVGLTPVLCDQLEAMRGEPGRPLPALPARDPRRHPRRGRRRPGAGGEPELAAEVRRAAGDYELAEQAFERRGRDLLGAFAGLDGVELWTSSATHAVLPLLATDAGLRLQLATGMASHERRFGEWSGGFWLPECAYEPGLERDLADHGVRAFCVDQTTVPGFDHLGPVATEAGPVAVPIDWQTVELVWNDRDGYPSHGTYRDYHRRTVHDLKPWNNAGEPYDHEAALALAREHARDFVRAGALRGVADGGLLCCALDTELLGHWWYEGPAWLAAVLEEAPRQGLELVTVSEGIERVEPQRATLAASTWGSRKDLSTWDSPRVGRDRLRGPPRRAAHRRRHRGARDARAPALERAARELLALQASDWAFMVTRELAGDYPRERVRGAPTRIWTPRSAALTDSAAVPDPPAQPGARPRPGSAHVTLMRALILSWEYPPLIEGGLARHVRKLAENLAAQDVDVHVLARGREEDPAEEEVGGVLVHRVREPERPRDLGEFVAWIEHMNSDMLAAGVEVGDRYDFDVVHGHDWLVASAGDHLANRFRAPFAVTIHATEYGRHQGWVDKHPQSYIHGVERWMANRAERVITCSAYMREHVADIYGLEEERVAVIPNGIDPSELVPVDDLDTLRGRFAAAGRAARAAGRPARLREGLPARARGAARADRAGRQRALPRRRLGHRRAGAARAGQRARPRRPRHVPRLDRRRRAALALPDRRPDGGPLDLRAVRPGRARGDGVGLPLPGRRHRRPARGRAERGRRPALPLARPRLARRRWPSGC